MKINIAMLEFLLQNQEPLGKDFQKVLDDNLWELMIHTDTKEDKNDEYRKTV